MAMFSERTDSSRVSALIFSF